MSDEKDRWGDKLRQKEHAEEERYFADREKALVAKLRGELSAQQVDEVREIAKGRCPKDLAKLVAADRHGVTVDECPTCHGMWLEHRELERVPQGERESWLGRLLQRPKR